MRSVHELILLFDSERWLLYAYPTRAPLFDNFPATCQRRFNVSRYVFFFITAIRVAYYLHIYFPLNTADISRTSAWSSKKQ